MSPYELFFGSEPYVLWERYCRAEVCSAAHAFDYLTFLRHMLVETLDGPRDVGQQWEAKLAMLSAMQVTDCKSLYDVVVREGQLAHSTEKRVQLDITDLRSSVRSGLLALQWCPTGSRLADGLTKSGTCCEPLLRLLQAGHFVDAVPTSSRSG